MKQLDYLWTYQELDLKIDELERKKKNSSTRKELYKSVKYLKNQQKSLIKLNNDFDKKNHIYNRIYHEFENLNKSLIEEEDILNSGNVKSFKQLDQMENKISEAQEKLKAKKQELVNLLMEIDILNKKLQDVSQRLRDGKKQYDGNKKEYDLEMKGLDSQLAQIVAERDTIGEKLNSSLLKRYEAVKGNHTTAVAEIEQNRCGGCNMTLASLVVQNVRDKTSILECENCGRILYSREDSSAS